MKVAKKGYRDSVTRKGANAQRKTIISGRREIVGVGVKTLCGQNGDVYKSKEKRNTQKKSKYFYLLC